LSSVAVTLVLLVPLTSSVFSSAAERSVQAAVSFATGGRLRIAARTAGFVAVVLDDVAVGEGCSAACVAPEQPAANATKHTNGIERDIRFIGG
jgi:hypothetical protein